MATTPKKTAAPAKKVVAKKAASKAAPAKKVVKKAAPARTPKPVAAVPAAPVEATKSKQQKPVRDSFTMPKSEYAVIDQLKKRAVHLKRSIKKSEVLRAGVIALARMKDADFVAALDSVAKLKTGRPKRD